MKQPKIDVLVASKMTNAFFGDMSRFSNTNIEDALKDGFTVPQVAKKCKVSVQRVLLVLDSLEESCPLYLNEEVS